MVKMAFGQTKSADVIIQGTSNICRSHKSHSKNSIYYNCQTGNKSINNNNKSILCSHFVCCIHDFYFYTIDAICRQMSCI